MRKPTGGTFFKRARCVFFVPLLITALLICLQYRSAFMLDVDVSPPHPPSAPENHAPEFPIVPLEIKILLDRPARRSHALSVHTYLNDSISSNPSNPTDFCDKNFGLKYFTDWAATFVTYCTPNRPNLTGTAAVDPDRSSKIECFPRTDQSVPLTFCVTTNSFIANPAALGGMKAGIPRSFQVGNCERHPDLIPDHVFGTTPQKWFVHALEVLNGERWEARKCDHVVEHPAFFLDRYDSTNMFHASEDMLTTFVTLLLLDKVPGMSGLISQFGMEVVVVDDIAKGYFMEFWSRLSSPFKVRFLTEDPYPPNTCFKKTIHNVHGGVSLLSAFDLSQRTECPGLLHQAYGRWVRQMFREFALHGPNMVRTSRSGAITGPETEVKRAVKAQSSVQLNGHAKAQTQNEGTMVHRVVYVSRSRFEKTHELGPWSSSRVLANEDEAMLAMLRKILQRNKLQCIYSRPHGQCQPPHTFFTFETVELSDMDLTQQFEVMMEASVLVGVHGAGLAHGLYLRPGRTALVELKPPQQMGSYHFQHIATWQGNFYSHVAVQGQSIPIGQLESVLQEAMDWIQERDRQSWGREEVR